MLLLAAAWLVLLAATTVTGLAVVHALRGGEAFDRLGDRLLVAAWLGLIAFGAVLQAASLFVALTPIAGAVLATVGVAGALSVRSVRDDIRALRGVLRPGLLVGGAVLLAGVAAYVAQKVVWSDTGLYHAGAIRWLSDFGAVQGVAHIHSRFGYSSLWFDLTAPFSDGDLRHRTGAVVSGFGLLLASAQLALAVTRGLSARARTSDWIALFALGVALPVVVWWKQPIAPNPDFPLVLLPIVCAWAMITIHGRPATGVIDARLIPLALACGAAAIKVSGLALVVVAAAFYLWPAARRPLRAGVAALAVALLFGPALTTGYVVSGCPLYPAPPCFDKVWALSGERAHEEAVSIRSYARRGESIPGEQATSTDWISSWLGRGQNLFLLLTLALGGAAAYRAPPPIRWLLALGFLGAVIALYSAPDLRFALGYSAVLVAAFCVRWTPAIRHGRIPRALPAVGATVVLTVLGALFVAARVARPTVDGDRGLALVAPPPMDRPALRQEAVGNVYYYVPRDGSYCWASPLPCSARALVRSDTTLRDPDDGLAGGFDHHRVIPSGR